MKLTLFLLAVSVGFHVYLYGSDFKSSVLQRRRRPRAEPGFDYFVLSLTWPNAFCKQQNVTCKPSPPKPYFTIHGLWPNKNDGFPLEYCEAKKNLTDDILNKYKEQLLKFWPSLLSANNFERSKNLWYRQWCKHGSCSSDKFPPDNYFNKTITLGSTYGPQFHDAFKAAGIKQNGTAYSCKKIAHAMKKVTGDKNGFLTCTNDTSKKLQLFEIRICFEIDAETLMNCSRTGVPLKCRKDLVFASPPP